MNPCTVTHLEIGHRASLPLRIPVVSLGSGQPLLSLLCGMHGDETSSLLIGARFLQRLARQHRLTGTVQLIPAANPYAQATGTRVALSDYEDLNRGGRGSLDGTLTERLGHALFERLRGSALVIDLHEFNVDIATMAVYLPEAEPAVDRTILRSIAALQPAFVWAVKGVKSGESSLSGELIRSGVPAFGLETSPGPSLTDAVVDQLASGLFRVAKQLGMLTGDPQLEPVPVYDLTMVYADQSGIWQPVRRLFDVVAQDDPIGTLLPFPLIQAETVASKHAGTVLAVAGRRLVSTGDYVMGLGTAKPELAEALERALTPGP